MRLVGTVVLAVSLAFAADLPKADLTLKDTAGHKVHLRDLRGNPVLLNFWATWCGPCKAEMPLLADFEKQYASRGIVFLGASLDEPKTRGKVPEFLAAYKIEFPVWYGATADDLDSLKLGPAVPATAFLDSEGRIVARILGQAREAELKERLDWLAGGQSGPAPAPLISHLEK